jgi:phosphoribosylformylglycinamidine (FGAM) synthase PurS component
VNGTKITGTEDVTGLTFPSYSEALAIGALLRNGTPSAYVNGWIDEVRIVNNTAMWTSNFTPPTSEYGTSSTASLQSYSEATIKTQGSYALKGVAGITDSSGKTLTKTLSTLNLTNVDTVKFDIRSSVTGANIKLSLVDTGSTISLIVPTISTVDTWQRVNWDISGVAAANKDAIYQVVVTMTDSTIANTFYIDNLNYQVK